MSSSRPFNNPWPAQTPAAVHLEQRLPPSRTRRKRSLKRRRIPDEFAASTSKSAKRQVVADQAEVEKALTDCQFNSGNNIISCFPSADTTIAQHQWASFVWNSRRPDITQTNLVDIFLFHGDSREQILHYRQVRNPSDQAGRINAQVNDSWWGSNGVKWNGENISYPFYWVLISSEKTLDGNQIAQPTFTAVQTTYADSVLASVASSSASAASVSSVSAASASSLTATITRSPVPTSSGAGSLQPSSSSSSFPHWAIAVIVVLGFLAIAATCVLAFLIIRRVRRRRQDELDSNRNSMGSASPMMANAGAPSSPLLAGGVLAGAGSVHNPEPPSVLHDMHDGASTISRTGSAAAGGAGDSGPFSGADAAIMADAFRKMLRKPDFAGGPVEEDAAGTEEENGKGKHVMINRELAEEGRDIRSVRSERGVKVETLSDSGDTVQDHQDRE